MPETYSAYSLQWTEFDNPNGWLEPTTFCQLKCPGCYRGLDSENAIYQHIELDELKNQIDWFIKNRNIQTISIAGGEPLLYPQLVELMEYAKGKKLRIMLYSNGLALTKEKLSELSQAGLTQLMIHVDSFQERPDLQGKNPNELRKKYIEMFKSETRVKLGFIQPVTHSNLSEINEISELAKQNCEIVNLIVFTLYRDICWPDDTRKRIDTDITLETIVNELVKNENFVPGAYLPNENSSNPISWLFGIKCVVKGKNVGYFSPSVYKFIQERYRKNVGKYLFITRNNKIKPVNLLRLILFKPVLLILIKYCINFVFFKKRGLFNQTFLIIRGADKKISGWDCCKGCPDRMIYKNRLVPSCILEDIKNKDNNEYVEIKFE